ncbi:carboxypeptidase regulatory-like domain-containing protein [Geomonas sp. RF6]|uniref:carboxypeptidase regulatory-like domain-containing protein n=1 Tax=Geomonas sp. RF6 TaxID=2897342 RepID=UPI001E6377A0|nr:carboxypeptidase regulatory-like domain-containing protein [Geomonas sp. RF6]UFS71028.1 carboxypeptidase regulatory-like domain-containing protein [Geomonas sp. RF6]
MRKYLWFPVLKKIAHNVAFATLLVVAAVCAAFSSAEAATGTLTTNHWKKGSTEGYSISVVVPDSTALIKSVAIDGPGLSGPASLDLDDSLVNFVGTLDLTGRPTVGDAYTVYIAYLDPAVPSEELPLTVSGVVDSFAVQGSPSGAIVGTSSPIFSWTAPSTTPSWYALSVTGMDMAWKSNTFAYTSTAKTFNFDGTAGTGATLTPGVQYDWSVFALDSNKNSAETRGSSFMLGVNFSGKVTDVNGAAVEGASVYVYDTLGNVQQNVATTGADGSYLYGGLAAGSYKIAFSKPPAFRVFYNNKLLSAEANLLTIASGVITQNVNAVIGDWGTVTGKVLNTSGAFSGVKATLYTTTGTPVSNVAPVYSTSDGSFTFPIVPAGNYKILFSGAAGYIDQWYAGGNYFNVSGGFPNPLDDTVLNKITLTGTVTDGSGNGIPDIWVWLYDASGMFPSGYSGVKTASDGTYKIGGVASGNYRVQFDSVGKYGKQYYNKKATLAEADAIALDATGTITNINAVLSSGKPAITTFTVPTASKSLTVSVTIAATEPNGVVYALTETSSAPTTWNSAPPAAYTFTSAGTKTLYAWAKGYNGLTTSVSKSVVIDTTPPTIALSALPTSSVSKNGILNLTGFVTVPYSTATLKINGTAVTVGSDGFFDYALRLTAGSNTVTLLADSSGLQSTITRTITYNASAPALTVTAPADNAATGATTVTVTGTVASGSTVQVIVNGTSQTATVTGGTFTTDVSLASGMNTLVVVATDASNNTTSVKRSVTLLSGGPELQITAPVEDSTNPSNSVTISGTVSTTSDTTVTISAGTTTYTPAVTAGSFSQVIPVVAGVNRVVVTAKDASGMETTAIRNVVVSGKAGDCNFDGKVSISELQSAISMYLMAKATTVCVDISGDSKVSISELQKVISAYLTP